ncbi:40261_t:CDS:2 [Gigaspora margarita]|uniref:40261_t:CDS:1 n=1 Tax=Gigaspora margarita TaxID=4874 RepID=A0ABN7UV02_GIGMA|nr:40261_t:CDS:2 [Gigaspora margarita]
MSKNKSRSVITMEIRFWHEDPRHAIKIIKKNKFDLFVISMPINNYYFIKRINITHLNRVIAAENQTPFANWDALE